MRMDGDASRTAFRSGSPARRCRTSTPILARPCSRSWTGYSVSLNASAVPSVGIFYAARKLGRGIRRQESDRGGRRWVSHPAELGSGRAEAVGGSAPLALIGESLRGGTVAYRYHRSLARQMSIEYASATRRDSLPVRRLATTVQSASTSRRLRPCAVCWLMETSQLSVAGPSSPTRCFFAP
jgi:hypothetical protein